MTSYIFIRGLYSLEKLPKYLTMPCFHVAVEFLRFGEHHHDFGVSEYYNQMLRKIGPVGVTPGWFRAMYSYFVHQKNPEKHQIVNHDQYPN